MKTPHLYKIMALIFLQTMTMICARYTDEEATQLLYKGASVTEQLAKCYKQAYGENHPFGPYIQMQQQLLLQYAALRKEHNPHLLAQLEDAEKVLTGVITISEQIVQSIQQHDSLDTLAHPTTGNNSPLNDNKPRPPKPSLHSATASHIHEIQNLYNHASKPLQEAFFNNIPSSKNTSNSTAMDAVVITGSITVFALLVSIFFGGDIRAFYKRSRSIGEQYDALGQRADALSQRVKTITTNRR